MSIEEAMKSRAVPRKSRPAAPKVEPREVYIPVAKLAAAMGWRVERMRRWLQREGALVKHGRHYFATRGMLRKSFPETWDEVVAALSD